VSLVLICLFNDAVNSSSYIASNNWMASGQGVDKNVEENGRNLIYRNIPPFH
jgi:hypothetical protein